jgi:predicted MFS family arabinose efflux permease
MGERTATSIAAYYADRLERWARVEKILPVLGISTYVLVALFAFAGHPLIAATLLILTRFPFGVMRVFTRHISNELLTTGSRATFLSVSNFGTETIVSLTALLFGYAAHRFGVIESFFPAALIALVLTTVTVIGFAKTYRPLR